MMHQSYVLLCSEIIKSMTWFGRFCIQFVTSKFFLSHIGNIKYIFLKIGGGCHDALKIYESTRLSTVHVVASSTL